MTKINSASRLNKILRQTDRISANTNVCKGWRELFSIESTDENQEYIDVTNKLRLLHLEVQHIKKQLLKHNVSADVWDATLRKAEASISPRLLHAQWNNVRQYLTEDTFVSLSFCSAILEDEESSISEIDFQDLRAMLKELNDLLDNSTLPDSLKALIRNHIELINSAISDYPISGANALRDASKRAIGDIVVYKDILTSNQDLEIVKKYSHVWSKLGKITDTAIKLDSVLTIGSKMLKIFLP